MELRAGHKLGRYRIVRRLAVGGMAEVYLARADGVGGFARPIALKRMLPHMASDPGFRAMFMREAAIAARLAHPHIVQILDFAEEDGELYLAMEYVHGFSLRQIRGDALARSRTGDSDSRLSPLLVAHLGRCIALALAHAWDAPNEAGRPLRLVHRDISPHNLLLGFSGDVKLADFGIAKPASLRTSVGMLKGKLQYMPPEQLEGGDLDARSDLFALGIVLWEGVLNWPKALFGGVSDEDVKRAVRERAIPAPERIDPAVPKSLSDVIVRSLARDPRERFQSAAELADALGTVLHAEARSPAVYDVAAFLRRLYGEPAPVLEPASAAASLASGGHESSSALVGLQSTDGAWGVRAAGHGPDAAAHDAATGSEETSRERVEVAREESRDGSDRAGTGHARQSVERDSGDRLHEGVTEQLARRAEDAEAPTLSERDVERLRERQRRKRRSRTSWFLSAAAVLLISLSIVIAWRVLRTSSRQTASSSLDAPSAEVAAPSVGTVDEGVREQHGKRPKLSDADGSRAGAASVAAAASTARNVEPPASIAVAAGGSRAGAASIAAAPPTHRLAVGPHSQAAHSNGSRPGAASVAAAASSARIMEPTAAPAAAADADGSRAGAASIAAASPTARALERPASTAADQDGSPSGAASVAAAPRTGPAAGAVPAARPSPNRPGAVVASRPSTGMLTVHIEPWAFVWIDDEPFTGAPEQEAAPVWRRQLPAGLHIVHLQDPVGRRSRVSIRVAAGRAVRVSGPIEAVTVR